jgi:pilus assembly protein FimV
VKHFSENEYDDDLTVGTDDQDESYYADAVDLFEITSDIEAPISRLKSLILSIDWEITDDVLLQFSEELHDLKDIWAGEKINLVYLQALEKICRYIYQKKADAHPHAIKLLLNLYHNLERIVSSDDLSDEAKKEILLDDIKRFENLKRAISTRQEEESRQTTTGPSSEPAAVLPPLTAAVVDKRELLPLKALVLGIDWEITDRELNSLRQEVVRLQEEFVDNRPAIILLQGIGSLAAYIKAKKSNAHADAFGVLHFFYESLERLTVDAKTFEEGKAILFPAVERFNEFKTLIGSTIASSDEDESEEESREEAPAVLSHGIVPALADVPQDVQQGFQAEEEARTLGLTRSDGILSKVEDFFGGDTDTSAPVATLSSPMGPVGEKSMTPDEGDAPVDNLFTGKIDSSVAEVTEAFFGPDGEEESGFFAAEIPVVEREKALEGVNVESDADDDSDEAELPRFGDEPAPALVSDDELFPAPVEAIAAISSGKDAVQQEISSTLDGFFGEESSPAPSGDMAGEDSDLPSVDRDTALQGVAVESEADDDSDEPELAMFGDQPAPALIETAEAETLSAEAHAISSLAEKTGDELEDTLDGLFGATADEAAAETAALAPEISVPDREQALQGVHVESEADDDSEEPALAMLGDQPAPALAETAEAETLPDEAVAVTSLAEKTDDELDDTLDEFFGVEASGKAAAVAAPAPGSAAGREQALQGIDVESEADGPGSEPELAMFDDQPEPVLAEMVETLDVEPGQAVGEAGVDLEEAPVPAEEYWSETEQRDALSVDEALAEGQLERVFTEEPAAAVSAPLVAQDDFGLAGPAAADLAADEAEEVIFLPVDEEELIAAEVPEGFAVETEADFQVTGEEVDNLEETEAAVKGAPSAAEGKHREDIGPLGGIGRCISSLAGNQKPGNTAELFREIHSLRQKWAAAPLEKTFLQLLSTVGQHIDRYGTADGSESHKLLQSVSAAFARFLENPGQRQDLLLAQTLKVLEWQQGLIAGEKAGQSWSGPVDPAGEGSAPERER